MRAFWKGFNIEDGARPKAGEFEEPEAQAPPQALVRQPESLRASANVLPPTPFVVLDAVGQQSENIRVRVSHMVDRLEEIRSLKDDLALLAEPVLNFVDEYGQLRSKLVEMDAFLKQERGNAVALRREINALNHRDTQLSDQLSSVTQGAQKHEAVIREHESVIQELRALHGGKEALAADLERQLYAKSEQARAVAEENQSLREATQEADQAVAAFERDLLEAREEIGFLEHENRSLRGTVGEQSQLVSALSGRSAELEHQAEGTRQRLAELQSRLQTEQAARQKLEEQAEVERGATLAQMSALELKADGLASRNAATDDILAHAREQLRERSEALRTAQRGLKEAIISKRSLEQQVGAARGELEKVSTRLTEAECALGELNERGVELTKAVSTRDALVESAEGKAARIAERADEATRRFEQERAALVSANRKLSEELLMEKSERALLQGALEAARESRTRVQQQLAAMRGKSRPESEDFTEVHVEDQPGLHSGVGRGNVTPLKMSGAD